MNKDFLNKKRRGFTLVELMVSVFIFMIIMTVVVEIFGTQVVTARNARILQRNIEEASMAMNYLAKTLRTSTLPTSESIGAEEGSSQFPETIYTKTIYAFDHSQGLCFKFSFEGDSGGEGKLMMYSIDKINQDGEDFEIGKAVHVCAYDSTYKSVKGKRLTRGNIKGNFYISPTKEDLPEEEGEEETYDESMGKVTISLEIDNKNTESVKQGDEGVQNMVVIQSSVSLRDYPGDITF